MTGKKKSLDTAVEQTFKVARSGRNEQQKGCLRMPALAEVTACQLPDSPIISLNVKCTYICGAHGGECRADSLNNHGSCPYSIDLPWAIDNQYGGEQ